jgi:hypothetical protein
VAKVDGPCPDAASGNRTSHIAGPSHAGVNTFNMIKNLCLVWLLILLINLNTQAQSTTNYAGTYRYGSGIEADAGGMVTVYPESDITIATLAAGGYLTL